MSDKPSQKDIDMSKLLGLLKERPDRVHALIVDHETVQSLLKSKGARELAHGLDPSETLKKAAKAAPDGSVGMFLHIQCLKGTNH